MISGASSLMGTGRCSLTFDPDPEAVLELHRAWGWLIGDSFAPLLFSIMGDVFYSADSGGVYWLNTGTAGISRVADDADHLDELLATELADEWLMPGLVDRLHEAGKIPGAGCCYTFATLPVFAEGCYEVSNLNAIPAGEHFALTGRIHREIRSLPDGSRVRIEVGP